jgi:tRNA U34 5-carboxymethylaminomethyl modifying GTPase MnmE/TrmE
MNKNTDFNFAKISKEQSNELTTMVKETVATGFVSAKSFTSVDLWNIQRHGKTTMNSRKLASFL